MNGNGREYSWRFLTPLYMGSTLNPINSSLLATALVPIAAGLHVAIGATAILVTSLYLASAIAQPTARKLGEEFGPRRVFLAGIVLVGLGGVLGGLGQNLTTLILSRVLIGIGTSAGYPCAMLLIRQQAESAGITKPPGGVLGGLQIAGLVTAALGLPLGGILVDAWGWHTTFLINIPFAVVAFILAAIWIPRDAPLATARNMRDLARRIDLVGIAGFVAATSASIGFLFSMPPPNWLMLAGGIVVSAAFIVWELRAERPFLNVRLLYTNGALARTYLRIGMMTLCVYSVLYGLTQWMQAARGVTSREAGLLLLPMTVISVVITRPISQRNLVRGPLVVAAATSILGSIGITFLGTNSPVAWIIAITLLFGITLGTASSSNQLALYSNVSSAELGTASGLFRTFGYIGSIASSAMIGIVFHSGASDGELHLMGAVMTAVSIAALAITLADGALHAKPSPPSLAERLGNTAAKSAS